MKTNDILLYGGLGLGIYLLMKKQAAPAVPVTSYNPGSNVPVSTTSQGTGANLITTTGNAITSFINQLTGNAPNPNNQIPVPVTPVVTVPVPVVSTPVITVPATSAQDLSAQQQGFADYAAKQAYDQEMYQMYQAGMLSGTDCISGFKLEFMRGGHTS